MNLRRNVAAARTVGAGTRRTLRRLSRDRMTRSPRTGAKTPGAPITTMSRSARIAGAPKSACGLLATRLFQLNSMCPHPANGKSHDRGAGGLARASDVFDVFAGKGRRTWSVRSFRMVALEFGSI